MRRLLISTFALAMLAALPAAAFHRSELSSVRGLAVSLERNANEVYRWALATREPWDRRDFRMTNTIRRFRDGARTLAGILHTYWTNPRDVHAVLSRLNRDAQRVDRAIFRSRAATPVRAEWRDCQRLLSRLNARVTFTGGPWRRGRGWGR